MNHQRQIKDTFSEGELQKGWRLACQTSISTDMKVYVPEGSLLASSHKILTDSETGKPLQVVPAVQKWYVQLPKPSMKDSKSDSARLQQAIGQYNVDLKLLQKLPKLLRRNNFSGTAVLLDHRLIDFESGDTTSRCYGAAFDIIVTKDDTDAIWEKQA